MRDRVQHPLTIAATIIGLIVTAGTGLAAYTNIKEDVAVLKSQQVSDSLLNEERFKVLTEDTKYIIQVLDELRKEKR
jgi:hypothetical protein